MVLVAPRSAKLVERTGARFTLLVGYVFCLLGFLTMLLLWKEGIPYWKVGLGLRLHRDRRRARRHAGLALAHRLGARHAGRHGLRNGRPAARPRRRDHAVDLRRAAHGGLRGGGRGRRSPASPERHKVTASVQSQLTKSFAGAEESRSSTRNTRARSPPPRRRRSCRATSGPTSPASSRSCSARCSSSSSFPASRSGRRNCSRSYHAEDSCLTVRASSGADRPSGECIAGPGTPGRLRPPEQGDVDGEDRQGARPPSSAPETCRHAKVRGGGIVVTEIATPTAELARSLERQHARDAGHECHDEGRAVDRREPVQRPSPRAKPLEADRRSSRAVSAAAIEPATPSPTASVTSARRTRRPRPRVRPTQIAVIGSRSGLTAIAPTIRMLVLVNDAVGRDDSGTAMKTR